MERASLTFELPDDQEAFEQACLAPRYRSVLTTLADAFRAHRKYDGPVVTEELFNEFLRNEDISLY